MSCQLMVIGESNPINTIINISAPTNCASSPSPAPQYDNFGRRVNTREYRYRKKLEDERHKLIEKAMKIIPSYHPPSDYRRPTKTQEKVYVPVNDYPEINFSTLTNPLIPPPCTLSYITHLVLLFLAIKSQTNLVLLTTYSLTHSP